MADNFTNLERLFKAGKPGEYQDSLKSLFAASTLPECLELIARKIRELEADPDLRKYIDDRNEAELLKIVEGNYRKCGAMKKDLDHAGFERFRAWNDNKNQLALQMLAIQFVGEVIRQEDFGKALLLYGKAGTGKTYFALSMVKMLCYKEKPPLYITKERMRLDKYYQPILDGKGNYIYDKVTEDANIRRFWQSVYVTSEEICETMYDRDIGKAERKERMNVWKTTPFLVIDEVGRGCIAASKERAALFAVINKRINEYLPMCICTNLSETEMADLFGDALLTRITSVGVKFCTDGIDNMRLPKIQKWLAESA